MKELFAFTPVVLAFSLLVFPGIVAVSGGQQQEPSPLTQQSSPQAFRGTTDPVPILNTSQLEIELVTEGLALPTSMAFIGNQDDLLILEKSGNVILLSIENKTEITIGNFTVNQMSERGLLGVGVLTINTSNAETETAAAPGNNNSMITSRESPRSNATATTTMTSSSSLPSPATTSVFFYLTEASKGNSSEVLGNRIYRFDWNDTDKSLSNGTLILDLPVLPGPNHNGGKLIVDSEKGHIYAVIGDLNRNGLVQNIKNGSLPDYTSAILRINPDGSPAQGNPFLNVSSINASYANLSKYYAYGIRNSFGLAIDPVTGILWDTENGRLGFDEINIVRPGFNSGWEKVMGPAERRNVTAVTDLVNFERSSSYADPVFSWARAVGVTDIEFYNSDRLGNNYTNHIFVGDFNNGNLYFFEVNEDGSGLVLENPRLADDLVASNDRQTAAVIFGTGFMAGITDIETGSDGYLYILTYSGKLYRIVPQR
jgi:aldose sugar dehydrogenase